MRRSGTTQPLSHARLSTSTLRHLRTDEQFGLGGACLSAAGGGLTSSGRAFCRDVARLASTATGVVLTGPCLCVRARKLRFATARLSSTGPRLSFSVRRLSLASVRLFRRAESLSLALRRLIVSVVRLPTTDVRQTSGAVALGRTCESLCAGAASRHVRCALRNAPPIRGPRRQRPRPHRATIAHSYGCAAHLLSPSLVRLPASDAVQGKCATQPATEATPPFLRRKLRSALARPLSHFRAPDLHSSCTHSHLPPRTVTGQPRTAIWSHGHRVFPTATLVPLYRGCNFPTRQPRRPDTRAGSVLPFD